MLADAVLIVHLLWVLAVVLPIPLILIGAKKDWHWIRSYPLRVIHLVMIAIVATESIVGIVCPLTVWEDALRRAANQTPYGMSFIRYWVGRILFYDFPPWVFMLTYVVVGLLVLFLFWKVPPQRRHRARR